MNLGKFIVPSKASSDLKKKVKYSSSIFIITGPFKIFKKIRQLVLLQSMSTHLRVIHCKAKIVPREEIQGHIIEKWEKRIVRRISNRLIKSLQAGVLTERHHEAHLPTVPKYLIEVDVEKVIDLTPPVRKSPDN